MAEASKHVWTDATQLEARLDAEFYQPHFLEAERKLRRVPTQRFHNLWRDSNRIYIGIAGFSERTQDRDYTPYIRPTDVGTNGEIDWNHIAWCYAEWLDDYSVSGCAKAGDLLVEVKGNTRRVAVVDSSVPVNCIVSGSFWRLTLADSVNPRFILAYLLSNTGQLLKRRWVSNSVISWIDPHSFRRFQIPVPDRRIQDYIGAKVKLAELCRSHSANLRSRAMELLAQSWAWGNRGPAELQDMAASQIAHTVEPRIFEDRLDPEFYRPSFLAVDRWLDGQPCWRLSELVEAPVKGVQPSYDPDGSVPALTVTNVDPFVLDRDGASGLVTDAWLSRNARARIEAGELLYTVTGPPLGETVVVEEFHLPAAVNSHVARVALRPNFKFPHLVAGMLNSPLGQLQTTRYSKGIRQKELYSVDFVRFRFPKLSSQTCTRLERDLAASCRLVEEARVLMEQAKADVEALIDGTLDEQAILAGTLKAPTADDIPELAEDDA
jgi:type I restriction enzyme S subunit